MGIRQHPYMGITRHPYVGIERASFYPFLPLHTIPILALRRVGHFQEAGVGDGGLFGQFGRGEVLMEGAIEEEAIFAVVAQEVPGCREVG